MIQILRRISKSQSDFKGRQSTNSKIIDHEVNERVKERDAFSNLEIRDGEMSVNFEIFLRISALFSKKRSNRKKILIKQE